MNPEAFDNLKLLLGEPPTGPCGPLHPHPALFQSNSIKYKLNPCTHTHWKQREAEQVITQVSAGMGLTADQTQDYNCMYVWRRYKWMCQRMMDDQGNVLHPWSLIQLAQSPIHLRLPRLPHLSGKSHFLCSGAWCLRWFCFFITKHGSAPPRSCFTKHLHSNICF